MGRAGYMKNIWILGAGRFGRIAIERLRRQDPSASLTVVDRQIESIPDLDTDGVRLIAADAIDYLSEHLLAENATGPSWIIPAVPLHVAYEWMVRRLAGRFRIEKVAIPQAAKRCLPNLTAGEPGTVYASIADFICPADCPEPATLCTHTGRPRPCNLYRELEGLEPRGWTTVVVRSCQLLPGVGGYRPRDLFQALNTVSFSGTPILLATACKCHAVVDSFQLLRT